MKRFFYIFGMAAWLLASGCSETAQVPGTEGEEAAFQIFTRANESLSVNQKAWLYLATREAENENTGCQCGKFFFKISADRYGAGAGSGERSLRPDRAGRKIRP